MSGKRKRSDDRYIVPGLARGLEALRAFTPEHPVLRLADLAKHLGATRSAAFRTAYTLTQMGCLVQSEDDRSFRLGPGVLRLSYGYIATREIIEVAQPNLLKLSAETDRSAHLGVLDGVSVLYMLRFPSPHAQTSIVHIGSRLPARSTAMGRVLLAALSEEELVRLYRGEEKRGGNFSLAQILAQWRSDRDRETIVQIGDFEADIASVAAALRDATGKVVAAISLTGPSAKSKIGELRTQIDSALVKAAIHISAQLGYSATSSASLSSNR